ncbi:5557_t:CDS:2 [Acaulospora colombiana]|uniref:5557_t:CDS:1 n=1 Tax=Acaulospora colombiana TaxID=27376 RepID=A0ACA9LGM5_9GLOM|nr:5557_t:CDS:2 [Acaulospora colombiana]
MLFLMHQEALEDFIVWKVKIVSQSMKERIFLIEYWDLTLAQEQEIFSRVQLGMPLTNAEKLASISSPTVDFAQSLYSTYNSISQIIETKRGKPLELITQTLYMIEHEPEKQVFTHNNLTKYLKDDREVPIRLKQTAKTVFETLDTLIEENVVMFNENHKFAPIEFVFFCLIIAKFPRLEIWQYQMYLQQMKEHVKTYHTDIRFNAKVYATLREYVVDLEPDELVGDYGLGKRSKCGFMAVESSKRIKTES